MRHKHGMHRHPLYKAWLQMRQRCTNPNVEDYKNYGGRGITVCARWDDFSLFVADVGERPPGMTLDRIDNDGDYEPGNVRWATPREQAAHRRHPPGRKLTAAQVRTIRALSGTCTQQELAARFGVAQTTISKIVLRQKWKHLP